MDGVAAGQVVTALPRPDATAARGTGPAAGFATTVPATPGPHRVCASAGNVSLGSDGPLGCLSVLVPGLTPAQIAAHSPIGMLDKATVSGTTVSLLGWAADPDALSQPLAITATVDGKAAVLTSAKTQSRPDVVQVKHTGPNQGYLLTSTVTANGLHTVLHHRGQPVGGQPDQAGLRDRPDRSGAADAGPDRRAQPVRRAEPARWPRARPACG